MEEKEEEEEEEEEVEEREEEEDGKGWRTEDVDGPSVNLSDLRVHQGSEP